MDPLKMYDLAPSPNSIKVRVALGYKDLPWEKVAVNPQDRAEIVRVSGQPLTPVLAHGDRVIFDSSAILRYLDANFRATPPLFSSDYETMKEIEQWEAFGRSEVAPAVGRIFGQFFAPKPDPAVLAEAGGILERTSARIEERLGGREWLVSDRMTAADVTAAPYVWYGMLPAQVAESGDIPRFFARHLRLPEARPRTRAWVSRVMAFDRPR